MAQISVTLLATETLALLCTGFPLRFTGFLGGQLIVYATVFLALSLQASPFLRPAFFSFVAAWLVPWCPDNTFEDDTPCTGFVWRDDLSPPPWGLIMPPAHNRPAHPSSASSVPEMALFSAAGAPDLFAGPFAKMIPPAYHQKILNNDFAVTSSTRLQVEAYRMETQHMIKVKYWVQDHLNALIFSVAVTTFPWFHPNDSPTITNRLATFNSTCETYDILDTAFYSLQNTTEDTDEWVTTSSATKVKPDVTLLLRVPGVTYCVGLRPSRKRALSQPEYERGSADHRCSPSADDHPPISPNSTPSPTKRLRPRRSTETLRSDNDHDSDLELQNEHPGTPTARRVLQILNAVLSSDSAHPSSSTSFLGPDTPRGRRSAFPLAFASDMDAGFRQISDLPADWSAQRHFEDVFGVLGLSFVASTYSENLKAWLNSDPEVMGRAVACGHHPGGEWAPIYAAWRERGRGKKKAQP
ncbi:hypothetical protein C8R47DRAFT_1199920 [Mycena vitilis]|nr:hypothetical protein C8R47DRAFT_1199920 [Mycena vitilis]